VVQVRIEVVEPAKCRIGWKSAKRAELPSGPVAISAHHLIFCEFLDAPGPLSISILNAHASARATAERSFSMSLINMSITFR
jgi:hypothetical protein